MSIKGLKQLGQSKPKIPPGKPGRSPIDDEFDDSDDQFGQKKDNIFDMDQDLEDYRTRRRRRVRERKEKEIE
jgi:hypothetical protein